MSLYKLFVAIVVSLLLLPIFFSSVYAGWKLHQNHAFKEGCKLVDSLRKKTRSLTLTPVEWITNKGRNKKGPQDLPKSTYFLGLKRVLVLVEMKYRQKSPVLSLTVLIASQRSSLLILDCMSSMIPSSGDDASLLGDDSEAVLLPCSNHVSTHSQHLQKVFYRFFPPFNKET